MSKNNSDDNSNVKRHTISVDTRPTVIHSEFSTIHVDKIMVAIDQISQEVSLTLLQSHLIPKFGAEGWILDQETWEIVGEVKTSMGQMNALMLYYVSEISNGLNILPLIQQHVQKNPKSDIRGSYGPTNIKPLNRNE